MAKRKKKSKSKSFFDKLGTKNKKTKLGKLRNQKTKPRVDPLWTLDDGITYSMISKFMNCRQRFHMSNVQGWKPKGINIPLEFGNMFHLMAEAQDMGISMDQMGIIVRNYIEPRLSDPSMDADKIKNLSMMAAICVVTFVEYVKFWDSHYSFEMDKGQKQISVMESEFEWLGKETAFDHPYMLPDGTKLRLKGKQDGKFIVRKLAKMGKWLFETKTKGDIDVDGITKGLHKDMQTGLYLTAMELEYGQLPAGVVYNCIRRTRLKPRVKDTPKSFAERVQEDIQKRPKFYFHRWTRQINEQELRDFQKYSLNPALFQVVQWWKSIKGNPMNPFDTPCNECGGTGKDMFVASNKKGKLKDDDTCLQCVGKGKVPNLQHLSLIHI